MDVLEVVSTAIKHILDLFEGERILNLGLDDAFFDENQDAWHFTLDFSRSWDNPHVFVQRVNPSVIKQEYKIVEIPDNDNKEISVRNYCES